MAAVDVISLSKEDFLRCKESISSKLGILLTSAALHILVRKPALPVWHLEEHK
jgi:hypothetical protein